MNCDSKEIEQAVREYQSGKNLEDNFRLIYPFCYSMSIKFFRIHYFEGKRFPIELCEDLTHDVILRVFKNINGFRHESSFYLWVYRITRSVLIDYLRDQTTEKRHGLHISLDSGGDNDAEPLDFPDLSPAFQPEEAARNEERKRILSEAAMILSPRLQQCWQLRHGKGHSLKEIAIIMGTKENTVKAQLDQAKEKMKAYILSKYGESGI